MYSTSYTADVVVYESTPGGIMSAVAASNNTGLKVILLSTTSHIGGMCSSGLGASDVGHNTSIIGGLALEFFTRNGQHYNKTAPLFQLEPSVAKEIFMEMLNESNVDIVIDSPIDKSTKDFSTNTITSFTTTGGNQYTAKIFIDASYEGDLFGRRYS